MSIAMCVCVCVCVCLNHTGQLGCLQMMTNLHGVRLTLERVKNTFKTF